MTGCISEQFDSNADVALQTPSTKIVNTPVDAVEGELLICLNAEASANIRAGKATELMSSNTVDLKSIKPIFKVTENNAKYMRKYQLDRWFKVNFEGAALPQAAAELAQFGEVSRVQYNKHVQYGSDTKAAAWTADESAESAELPFNDPLLKDQWHYINTGSKDIASAAVEGADIAVKDVWGKLNVKGSSDIIVAIVDGPVKYDHVDLAGNMWVNNAEKNGRPGVDDDKNGYTDDVYGWNCDQDTCKIVYNVYGESGHGTHVAGIVGAVNGNNEGVCGVAGGTGNNDGVRLMSCQIFTAGMSSNVNSAAIAFVYAADNGAQIAQCSFGYQNSTYGSDMEYFQNYSLEYFAIQYFLDKDRFKEVENRMNRKSPIDGPLAIFASGNDGMDRSSYPGALMECICVTGIGPDGYPAYYTNFGPGCNIAAPGGDYYLNTINSKSQILSTYISEVGGQDYAYMGGTSMACPHVSGVAALGLEYASKLGKTFTREEFVSRLLTSVSDLDSKLNSGYKFMGYDPTTGSEVTPRPYSTYQYNMGTGLVDAWKFMMSIEGTPCLSVKLDEEGYYDLADFFGEAASYLTYKSITMSSADMKALGISSTRDLKIENGRLYIYASKPGSAKVTVKAIAGGKEVAGNQVVDWTGNKDYVTVPNSNDKMGGMEVSREFSIVVRGVGSSNGGWL